MAAPAEVRPMAADEDRLSMLTVASSAPRTQGWIPHGEFFRDACGDPVEHGVGRLLLRLSPTSDQRVWSRNSWAPAGLSAAALETKSR